MTGLQPIGRLAHSVGKRQPWERLLRRLLLACSIPLILSACDQNPAPPQSESSAGTAAQATAAPAPASQSADADSETAPLFGRWAADLSNCGTPIVISATSFEGAENICDITDFADNGDGSFTASLTCTGEGQTATERIVMTPLFGPAGEGIRLNYLDRGGDPVTVFRCKGPLDAAAGQ